MPPPGTHSEMYLCTLGKVLLGTHLVVILDLNAAWVGELNRVGN